VYRISILVIACLLAGLFALSGTPVRADTIDVSGTLDWSVQYLIDQSQAVGPGSQFSGPRDNRGLALSPDGRYLYAGYNNGGGPQNYQVRKIDTTVADYNDATVAILQGSRGKAIATDDVGRVYLAEGSSIKIYDGNLATLLFTISGLTVTEGVAVTRESGDLVLYATDRTNKTLTRWVVTEGGGGSVTGVTKTGLDGDGEITVTGASNLRGVEVDPAGKIWMADISADKVFRVNSDSTGLTSVSVDSAMDIAFDDTQAFVTQYTTRTITVLAQGDMSTVATLTPPWASLQLDPDGQSAGGALSGIVVGDGSLLYVANEAGQTADEQSTYGRCDAESDNPGGPCTLTDTSHDDNDPILKAAAVPPPPGPFGVGGIVDLPAGPSGSSASLTDSSGSSVPLYAVIAVAAVVLALAAGGWYAKRRWVR
jgi:sugar lactone lactonase YvrE